MIILIVLAASLILALARGGKLGNLSLLNIRWSVLIFAGFLVQLLIFQPFWQDRSDTRALTPLVYLISLGILLPAIFANFRLPGLPLLILGYFLNLIAIVANRGHMPASANALAISGLPVLQPGEIANNSIGTGADIQVPFLTDIFAIPSQFLLNNVYSIGDILIALGGFYLIQRAMVRPDRQATIG